MNIVILGGGTAGWLAALFICKIRPEHTVTVIESTDIGIVGAGEGSTGLLTNVITNQIWNFGCDHDAFLKETGATLKYGIMHKNWTGDNKSYFGPIDGSISFNSVPDAAFCFQLANHKENLHEISEMGLLFSKNSSHVDKVTKKFRSHSHALHFDAHKVGQYFKKISLAAGVKHIDNKVVEVKLTELGYVKSLVLQNNVELEADFFIDASGFERVIVKKLGTKWISYKDNLPVNSAMPFLIDYENNETPEPYTTAWAQSAGWMWQIPTQIRKGCGYVFCDDFITAEQAQEEIEKNLQKKIKPIRVLKFETGRLENTWIKNCLSIGLCAAFAEPLEATSIHSTIVQISKFVFEYLKTDLDFSINEFSIKQYNKQINKMYDDFKDFLNLHYMGGRHDSEFWKYVSSGKIITDKNKDLIEMCKYRIPTINDFDTYYGSAGWPLYSHVLAGTNNLDGILADKELDLIINNENLRKATHRELLTWRYDFLQYLENNLTYKDFIKEFK